MVHVLNNIWHAEVEKELQTQLKIKRTNKENRVMSKNYVVRIAGRDGIGPGSHGASPESYGRRGTQPF